MMTIKNVLLGLTGTGIIIGIGYGLYRWGRRQQLLNLEQNINNFLNHNPLPDDADLSLYQTRINYTAHEYLEPAPQIITMTGPFTVENVMEHVREDLLLQDHHSIIENTLRAIEGLHIWSRIFIHDPAVGILDLRNDIGTDFRDGTICIRI